MVEPVWSYVQALYSALFVPLHAWWQGRVYSLSCLMECGRMGPIHKRCVWWGCAVEETGVSPPHGHDRDKLVYKSQSGSQDWSSRRQLHLAPWHDVTWNTGAQLELVCACVVLIDMAPRAMLLQLILFGFEDIGYSADIPLIYGTQRTKCPLVAWNTVI